VQPGALTNFVMHLLLYTETHQPLLVLCMFTQQGIAAGS